MPGAMSIAEVARMQVMSSDFADWCVTNMSDPAYDYLFSKGSTRRHEFEVALQAARASLSGSVPQAQPGVQQQQRFSNNVPLTNGVALAAPAAALPAAPNPAHCSIPLPTATLFTGPHQPYQLQGADKQRFESIITKLHALNPATTGPNSATTSSISAELVEFMLQRKTKTESMVHRLVASMGGIGLQKRLETFYVLSTLFYEHRNNAEPNMDPAYMAVFATYLAEALRLALLQCKTGDSEVAYISSIVDGWESAEAFNRNTLGRMRAIITAKSAGQ